MSWSATVGFQNSLGVAQGGVFDVCMSKRTGSPERRVDFPAMSGPDMGDIHHHRQTAVVFPRKPKGELKEDEYPNPFRRKSRIQPKFDVALVEHVSFEKRAFVPLIAQVYPDIIPLISHEFDDEDIRTIETSTMSTKEHEAWKRSFEESLRPAAVFGKDIEKKYEDFRDMLASHAILQRQYLQAKMDRNEKRAQEAREKLLGPNANHIADMLTQVVSGFRPKISTRAGSTRFRNKEAVKTKIREDWQWHTKRTLVYLDTVRDIKTDPRAFMMFSSYIRLAVDHTTEVGEKLNQMVRNRRISF